ncbi:SymE family type I addiction module toxin [Erwinia oleae]|uniref:SymE family type I addiction module toxin n=1 Tax=Erwinia oleae TaxID=796334 RepID=UPI00190F56CE|nr:SymE family type I addiction module toxin [Erwinia oleae]
MAETHHKPEMHTPTTRCYTVGYVSDAKYQPVPAVTLKSHWFEEAGFETGTPLEVKVLPDCLILTVKQPSPEPEVIQALHQLCPKLSARKQRELMDVIQVMAKPKRRAAD